MYLKELRLENFLSYRNTTVKFTDGLFLVDGYNYDNLTSNGAGKSALFDAIVYVLYGKTPRNCKLDDFIRNGTSAHLQVQLSFQRRGKEYLVRRSRNPDGLELLIDGVKFSNYVDISELNQKIIDVIGLSYYTFVGSVYFVQNRLDNFLVKSDEEKKELLTELLGLDILDDVFEKVKLDVGASENRLNLANQKFALLNNELTSLRNDLKDREDFLKGEKDRRDKEILDLNNKVKATETKIQDLKDHAARFSAELGTLPNLEEQLKSQTSKKNKITQLEKEVVEKTLTIQGLEKSIVQKNAELESQQAFLKKGLCFTCGQKIYESDRINQTIQKLQEEVANFTQQRQSLLDARLQVSDLVKKFKEKVESECQKLERQIIVIESYPERIENDKATILLLNNDLQTFNQMIVDKQKMSIMSDDWKLDLEKKINQKAVDIITLDKEKVSLESYLALLNHLKSIFSKNGIKAKVFAGIVHELNSLINKYLEDLFAQNVILRFDLTSEVKTKGTLVDKFSTRLMINGQEMPYGLLSGGEKRRLILATDFALAEIVSRRSGVNFEFIILDEVFNDLDTKSKEKILEFLKILRSKKKQIWVIDHSSEMKAEFDQVIKIEKRNGISQII